MLEAMVMLVAGMIDEFEVMASRRCVGSHCLVTVSCGVGITAVCSKTEVLK